MKSIWIATLIAAPAVAEELRMTVYDGAGLPAAIRAEAADSLGRIFRLAGVNVIWVDGDLGAEESSRVYFPEPARKGRELTAGCAARREIALKIHPAAAAGIPPAVLGMAHPMVHAGLNVQVFYDRVGRTASRQNARIGTILAHVIGHEIGHVLLRSNDHGPGGIMSSRWIDSDYRVMSGSGLLFRKPETERIRRTLSGAGCTVLSSR